MASRCRLTCATGAIEQDADAVVFLWPASVMTGTPALIGCKLDKNCGGRKSRFGLV